MAIQKRLFGVLLAIVILCGIGVPALALEPGAPTLGEGSGAFDKDARADITFDIAWGDATGIAAVSFGGQALVQGEDYAVTGDTLTVKKEFLFTRQLGTQELEVTFNDAAATQYSRDIRVFFDAQVWITTLHPWLRFHPNGAATSNNKAAYDDFAEFLSDTANWEYVSENIDVIEFLAVTTTSTIISDELVIQFCDMIKGANAKREAAGKKKLQISFQAGGILAYAGAGAKGSFEEALYWFQSGASEGLVSAIPRMKAQGVYADYIHFDGTISRATGNQAAASGNTPSPDCPVMTQAQAIDELIHLMRIYMDYYSDVNHDLKFLYLFNYPNHSWKGGRAVTLNGSGYSDAYSDLAALDRAAKAARVPLLGFTLDSPYNYRGRNGIDTLERLRQFELEARALGYTTGIVFNTEPDGEKGDTCEFYYKESLKFIEAYESMGGRPDVYHAMSWYNTAPATHLPENDPRALTYQAKAFIEHVKHGVPVHQLGDPGWFYAITRCNGFWRRLVNILSLGFVYRDYQRVEIAYAARADLAVAFHVGEKGLEPSAIPAENWKAYDGPFYIHPGFFFGLVGPRAVYVKAMDGSHPAVYTVN